MIEILLFTLLYCVFIFILTYLEFEILIIIFFVRKKINILQYRIINIIEDIERQKLNMRIKQLHRECDDLIKCCQKQRKEIKIALSKNCR